MVHDLTEIALAALHLAERRSDMTACDSQNHGPDIRAQLLELYTRLANEPDSDFGWGRGKDNARALGYPEDWLNRLPDGVWESAAAVGNPFSLGPIRAGETIVDIGCGAGADACVAALLVGGKGKVAGIDCTPAMIDKAASNAAVSGFSQIVYHEAEMAALPLLGASADVVISNGAINLGESKTAVLGEIFRVLRPGGRLQIADMVRDPSQGRAVSCNSEESWADCVSGTLEPDVFISMLTQAGFVQVELTGFTGYKTAPATTGALIRAVKPR
ncbi:MAG: methyltransferase domain-containing protein [Pseudomonadota bacterium]|nr:methyltransferase domain-containing protein [Pseudomonadota bacterium]